MPPGGSFKITGLKEHHQPSQLKTNIFLLAHVMTISTLQLSAIQRFKRLRKSIVPFNSPHYFLYFIKTDIKEQLSFEVLEAVLCLKYPPTHLSPWVSVGGSLAGNGHPQGLAKSAFPIFKRV